MKICLLDPALFRKDTISPNIGDQIISRAVQRELKAIFGASVEIARIPTHSPPTLKSISELKSADHIFVGGSNLLWFRWWRPASWKLGPFGLAFYRNLVLLGVGWGGYDIRANTYGRWVSNVVLSGDRLHSVRDSFTANIVQEKLKLANVVNTACPTMWCLTPELLGQARTQKGDECIFSLTDYDKNPELDKQLIHDLNRLYSGRLLFWPQGKGDLDYCRSLGYAGKVIPPVFESFLKQLTHGYDYDYVGTRLHAGVLCMEHRVRTLIIAIDNRAKEISSDTGLPTIERGERDQLIKWADGASVSTFTLPNDSINRWKNQFNLS
jgi:polysaccharide pyruvyl transferase WcaK-like protein